MSGSSDGNVNVTITATDNGFVATTKAAQAAVEQWAQITGQASNTAKQASVDFQGLINSTTGVSNAQKSAADSAEVFRKALGDASNEVKQLRNNMNDAGNGISNGMNKVSGSTSNVTRELVVLGHEAMSGRFSRIPGSVLVLAEYLGQAGLAVTGLIAGFAMAAIGAEKLIGFMGRINSLKTGVQSAGAFFNPGLDQQALTDMAMKFRQLKDVTTEDSQQVVAAYARMQGATIQTVQALVDETQKFAEATGEKLPVAAENLKRAFESPTADGLRFLQSINASSQAINAFNAVSGENTTIQRRVIMLNELDAATQRVAKTQQNVNKNKEEDSSTAMMAYGGFDGGGLALVQGQWDVMDEAEKKRITQHNQIMRDALTNMSNVEQQTTSQTPTWFELQAQGADELKAKIAGTATDYKQEHIDEATSLRDYWQQASTLAQAGSKDQMRANEQYLRYKEQADLLTLKLDESTAKSSLEAQLAALTAQQKAAGENRSQILALEDQKLALLRAAYGEDSKQYQTELAKKLEMETQFTKQSMAQAETKLKNQERLDAESLATTTKRLNAEVQLNKLTKAEAIDQLKALVDSNAQAELGMLDTLQKTLTEGTAAWSKAADQKLQIETRLKNQLASLDQQRELSETSTNNKIITSYVSLFDSVQRSAQSSVSGLMNKTETWRQAEAKVINSVLTDFVSLTAKMLAQWAVKEVAQTNITTANAVVRSQAEGGTGLVALIAQTLMRWLGLETSKTTITTTQATARTIAQGTADATQESAQTTSNGISLVQSKLVASSEIQAAAAVAGANAFAATAAIPMVGLALAPGAAAAAVSAVEGMQGLVALDVGAYNVPQDMPAYIHQGEMVVPADFASGLRSGGLSSMSGASNTSSNTGGGVSPALNVTISAIDLQTGAGFLKQQLPGLARMLYSHWQNNASTRPAS